jgi:predicted GNAT family N-acyltransferase
MEMSDNYKIIITDYLAYAKDIRSIRTMVFVVEQSVPAELEHDEHDETALHAVVFEEGSAVATGRMLEDGHIGRIAVLRSKRGKGVGGLVMQAFFQQAKEMKLNQVWLSSQCHAQSFYGNLGFVCVGEKYQEAGIDHIKMTKAIQ